MASLLKEKIILIFLCISLAFLLSGLILILANANNLSSPLITHINAYTGVDMMGGISHLWILFSMGTLIFLINLGLIYLFFFRERIVSYIILGVTFLTSLLTLVSIGNIIALN